jgi:hypothetical protein
MIEIRFVNGAIEKVGNNDPMVVGYGQAKDRQRDLGEMMGPARITVEGAFVIVHADGERRYFPAHLLREVREEF